MRAMDVKTKNDISIDHFIARIDWYQAPTVSDLVSTVRSILSSKQYHQDLRLLIVDHGTDFDLSEPEVQALMKAQSSQLAKFKSCAIATKNDRQYSIAREVFTRLLGEGIVLGAFKDEVAAGVWLLGDIA
jgi:hypothetical protein